MQSTVAIVQCPNYDFEQIGEGVHRALEHLGGIGQFVRRGQQVLIKPNMLSAKTPEKAVTTHPAILEAVVREVFAIGGKPVIGDSPSGANRGVARCWEMTGFKDVSERTGARLINFEAGGTTIREIGGRQYHVAKAITEFDVIINLPKFKTHGLTLYTGAIKNLYGCLPGFQKTVYHRQYSHPRTFSEILVDLYALIRPALHVMDAVVGMEGNGPATGDLRQTGLILASSDGVALDAVASRIMGFHEGAIDAVRIAGERELGTVRLDDIEIRGGSLESVLLDDFKLPSNYLARMVPQFVVRLLGRFVWVRPRADLEKCTGCGICAESCPVHAIEMSDGHPVMDFRTCINCLCCNESCPEGAVIQRRSWLARRFS